MGIPRIRMGPGRPEVRPAMDDVLHRALVALLVLSKVAGGRDAGRIDEIIRRLQGRDVPDRHAARLCATPAD